MNFGKKNCEFSPGNYQNFGKNQNFTSKTGSPTPHVESQAMAAAPRRCSRWQGMPKAFSHDLSANYSNLPTFLGILGVDASRLDKYGNESVREIKSLVGVFTKLAA